MPGGTAIPGSARGTQVSCPCGAGVVTKMKMQRTIVIRRDYLHYIRKYNRFEKRHKNMSVHLSPCFRCVRVSLACHHACPCWCVLLGSFRLGRHSWAGRGGFIAPPHLERALGYDVQSHDGLQSPPAEGLLTMPLACTEPGTTCGSLALLPEERPGCGSEGQGSPGSGLTSRCHCRDVQIGDIVTVGECRPLSKTVRFNVLKVTKAAGTKKQFQKF